MAFSLNRFLLFEKPPEEKLTAQQQLQLKIPPKITARNLECRDDDSNFSVSAPSTQQMNETHSHCLVAAWLFFYIHRRWWQQHFSCVVFVANGNCHCACICYVPNVIKLPLPTKQLSFGLIFLSCSFARSQNKNDGSCFGAVLIPFRKSWGLNAVDTFRTGVGGDLSIFVHLAMNITNETPFFPKCHRWKNLGQWNSHLPWPPATFFHAITHQLTNN